METIMKVVKDNNHKAILWGKSFTMEKHEVYIEKIQLNKGQWFDEMNKL